MTSHRRGPLPVERSSQIDFITEMSMLHLHLISTGPWERPGAAWLRQQLRKLGAPVD